MKHHHTVPSHRSAHNHSLSALFICRVSEQSENTNYGYFRRHSGLLNSAKFVADMLTAQGHRSLAITANDNNDIDRLVTLHSPKYVFIEALWVVPEKFDELKALHPHVIWVIRLHSQLPFLATEGVAVEWIFECLHKDNVYIAPNTLELTGNLQSLLPVELQSKVVYLPNYYPVDTPDVKHAIVVGNQVKSHYDDCEIHIGCFGAIRPLKNQLPQAFAALKFADSHGFKLSFHINSDRVESGQSNLRNIRTLFDMMPDHTLVEHEWVPHKAFLEIVATMNLGMQVSYSESFNIVTADMVATGVPVVTSSEVSWVYPGYYADPNKVDSMVAALNRAYITRHVKGHHLNKRRLRNYSLQSVKIWLAAIG